MFSRWFSVTTTTSPLAANRDPSNTLRDPDSVEKSPPCSHTITGRRFPGRAFDTIVNESLLQTVARSLTTSLTLVFTLVALLLFGGVTIHNFVLCMLIGVISGTYSSIFIASQLLVMWEHGEAVFAFAKKPAAVPAR